MGYKQVKWSGVCFWFCGGDLVVLLVMSRNLSGQRSMVESFEKSDGKW